MDHRIALFIDGTNLHRTAKFLGFEIDYRRLRAEFERRGTLVRAYYYTAVTEEGDFDGVRPLLDWLDYNGFTVKTKPAKEVDDGEGRRRLRRNIEVDLTVDALDMAIHVDGAYIFSGNGDFLPLIESLQRRGVRVTIVSSTLTAPQMVAGDLRRQADTFVELNSLRALIERSHTNRQNIARQNP